MTVRLVDIRHGDAAPILRCVITGGTVYVPSMYWVGEHKKTKKSFFELGFDTKFHIKEAYRVCGASHLCL